ncbi:MAG: gamma-glutamyltransferase [Kiloniellales bacterium]
MSDARQMTRAWPLWLLPIALLVFSSVQGAAQETAVVSPRDIFHPVFAENGMVASQEATATRIGVDILKRGGNAIDAGVAVGFALAVTLPRAGALGGGGFMMVHHAETGETVAIDYREMAPAAAHRDMYLDAAGEVDTQLARYTHHAAGVPGAVAGLVHVLDRYGTLPLAEVLAPAIRLAERGILVTQDLSGSLESRRERLQRWPATAAIFYHEDGRPYRPGERLIQVDLAWSLRQIAAHGADAFYKGAIAERIAADMAAHGGPMTLEDLAAYRVAVRAPVRGTYRGYEIASMPPPSSGGVHLVQILNLLEDYPLASLGHNGAEALHLMAESMKLAYADRSQHLGDPDFWPVPVAGLISKAYAESLRATIDPARARPAAEIAAGDPMPYESPETTHYSVMDRWGNVVSNTYTINFGYGSGIVAAGTGILLNNEMDDFSAKPGVPNAYGLLGGDANSVAPAKRPLSSMTPTILFKDGKPLLATGSPGGSRIITTTLQIILNVVDHGMNIAAATAAPRVHHQWLPDELRVEAGLSPDTIALLESKGHKVVVKNVMGSTQSILRADEGFYGASDPRRQGALTLGF